MKKILNWLKDDVVWEINYYKDISQFSNKEYMASEKKRYEDDCKIVFDTMRNNYRRWWD